MRRFLTSRFARLARGVSCAGLLGLLAPDPVSAQTMAEAVAAVLRGNPHIAGARLGLDAASEDRVQARAAFLPRIDLSATQGIERRDQRIAVAQSSESVRRDLHPSTLTVLATQDLYTGGRRGAQMRAADAGIAGAEQDVRATEQRIILAAVTAYANVWRDQRILDIRRSDVAALGALRTAARKRLDAGEATRTDMAQSDARLSGGEAALALALAQLEASHADFEEVVGQPAADISEPPLPGVRPDSLQAALRDAVTGNPRLAGARQAVLAAEARADVERADLLPRVALVIRHDRGAEEAIGLTDVNSSSARVQLSVSLYSGGGASSRARQSDITARRAQAAAAAEERAILADVVKSWHRFAASQRAEKAAGDQANANETAVEGMRREQGLGLRTMIEVLDAQQDLAESRIVLARVQADAVVAAYALLTAQGVLDADRIGLPTR